MGRPARSLAEHVRQGSFRSRRHHELLEGPDVEWAGFAQLQARYRAASSYLDRRAIGLQFAQTVSQIHQATAAEADGQPSSASLDRELAALGDPGSIKQLLGFFPHFLRHAKGPLYGQPFELEGWQKSFLRELYRCDSQGRRIYKRALLGLPHGNGKTALAAGLALYELVSQTDAPEVYLAAGCKAQAMIGLDFARSYVRQGQLADWITTGSSLTCTPRHGSMQALSSEGALQQGRAPSAAIVDELGTLTTGKQEQTYKALATALGKRPDAYLLATTTAGLNRDSLLGRFYQEALGWDDIRISRNGCLTVAKNRQAGALLWWYGAPAGSNPTNPKIIRGCNPASWIPVEALQQQALNPGLNETDFRRHHLNQWTPQHSPPRPAVNPQVSSALRGGGPPTQAQLEQLLDELSRGYPPEVSATTPTPSSAPPRKAAQSGHRSGS